MRAISCVLVTLCLVTITHCETAASATYEEVDNSELIAEVIQEVIDTTRSGLADIERKTKDITRSLQENIVDVIYEGKETLFVLKEHIKGKFDAAQVLAKCDVDLLKELEVFESNIRAKLKKCAGNVFEYSESYRRKVKDDVQEIESGLDTLKTTDNCFGGQSGTRRCYADQINEYRKMSHEISAGFNDIYNDAKENAIEVLNDLMECNKAVIKEAKNQQKILKEKLDTCTK